MGKNTIKGLTVEIGGDTTELGKALKKVEDEGKNLSSELGQINKLLKMDPSNVDLLAQKQKVLADAVTNTRQKLDTLKEAEKQVQEQFERGEVSEAQVRELQREIITAENKLRSYENAAKETAEALEKFGQEAENAGTEVDNFGDQTENAEKETENLDDTLNDSAKGGFNAIVAVATAAATAVIGCVEASEDYRREIGKLNTAFETNGFTVDAAQEAYKELQSVIGETDQTVEAVNHLAELVDTEKELANWTGDILPGVYAKFGASLQPEALTEAANETSKTATVTGALADALNWAAQEGETFGVALKENTEANEDWNKSVKEAKTAEDYFNLALQECNSQQERQQLITSTLTKLYSKAAAQYKKTNKAVIESNKATEKWNETVAEVGEEMAPVTTEIKNFGTALLEEAQDPLKDTATFITKNLLPALSSVSRWTLSNVPTIKAGVTGLAVAYGTYKVAVLATDIAHKGLGATLKATTVAQTALNIAQSASPIGLIVTAVVAATAALMAYGAYLADCERKVTVLTEEEQKLKEAAQETAAELRDQRAATDETLGGISSQMNHVSKLADELRLLADESGRVAEADQTRAQFILNELNEALGTEYTMTDGVIQKYGELKDSIDQVILSKTANALLETKNADYLAALQAEDDLLQGVITSEKDYQGQLAATQAAEEKYANALAEYSKKSADAKEEADWRALAGDAKRVESLRQAAERQRNILEDRKADYDAAALAYGQNSEEIIGYEEAQQAALEGNYEKAKALLLNKGVAFGDYADGVSEASAKALDALYKEAIDAGIAAERTKKNFEDGIEGYTKEMVDEAEQAYEDALDAYGTAYEDAHGVGEDMGQGVADGMESKRSSLLSKIRNIVSAIIGAARQEADSHSPSRKMIDFGEDMGEGADIGLENKTKDILKTAHNQVGAVLGAYSEAGENHGQLVSRAVQSSPIALQNQSAQTGISLLGKLDCILSAIERGQILTIDGKTWVGATADQYDKKLGQMRILAERGAL